MTYDTTIAKITGQDKILQETLYKTHQEKSAIFHVKGEKGSGKKTLCRKIAEEWQKQSEGVVLELSPSEQTLSEEYSVFKNFVTVESSKQKQIINVFQEITKEIPHIGNSLSLIVKELLSVEERKEQFHDTISEIENFIISKVKQISRNKNVLLLCLDYNNWDIKSKQLICTLMRNNILVNCKNVYYIISSSAETDEGLTELDVDNKYIKNVECEQLEKIIQIFNPKLELSKDDVSDIYDLTDGNIYLIKELISLYSEPYFRLQKSFMRIIEKYLETKSVNAETLMQLLRDTAFIGKETDVRLLQQFSDISSHNLDDIIEEATCLSLLNKENYIISFVKTYIYMILEKNQYNSLRYYTHLCECINRLYPTRYDLQMYYAKRGNRLLEAERYFLVYAIKYYRENHVLYPISSDEEKQLKNSPNYFFYIELCKAYAAYKKRDYTNAENILLPLYTNVEELRFEKEYLHSLIVTNKYNSSDYFSERIDMLQTYLSENFEHMYPEMYLRALMILSELYAEIGKEHLLKECLRKINTFFSEYSSTDKQIERYEYCFKLKSNAFYKIEIATKYTEIAYNYFRQPENIKGVLSNYYLSLLNYSANLTVLSKHDVARKLLIEAYQIVRANKFLKNIHKDILLNNFVLNSYYVEQSSIVDCQTVLKKLIENNAECADNLLIKNNYIVFIALNGDLSKALLESRDLYLQIKYDSDMDDYYQYYILNNYGILLWLNNNKEEACAILAAAAKLMPWPRDKAYFNARIEHINNLIENIVPETLLEDATWNDYISQQNSNVVGTAWKFWSSLLLFSELQIWSDY